MSLLGSIGGWWDGLWGDVDEYGMLPGEAVEGSDTFVGPTQPKNEPTWQNQVFAGLSKFRAPMQSSSGVIGLPGGGVSGGSLGILQAIDPRYVQPILDILTQRR